MAESSLHDAAAHKAEVTEGYAQTPGGPSGLADDLDRLDDDGSPTVTAAPTLGPARRPRTEALASGISSGRPTPVQRGRPAPR